jgi:hypothetical protein
MWDTRDTTHHFTFFSEEANQVELYFYLGETRGTQLTLLRFVVTGSLSRTVFLNW